MLIMEGGIELMNRSLVNYWCSAGTVLGLVRESKGYIDYDTDIDVEVWVRNKDDVAAIKRLFSQYPLVRSMSYFGKVMQLVYMMPFNILFDIYFYYEKGSNLINHNNEGILKLPKRFIESKELVKGYICPSPVKKYLVYRYGEDWMIPTGEKTKWSKTTGEALK